MEFEKLMTYLELKGEPTANIYLLYLHGGSEDGKIVNSFRPYDSIKYNQEVYKATSEGEECLVFVSDFTYRIDLYFQAGN